MLRWLKSRLGAGNATVNVGVAEAQNLLSAGAALLDVRSEAERQAISIPGSRHIPLEMLANELANELATEPGQLPQDKVIVCQCASGHRSGLAAGQLRAQGYDARSLAGGITAWKNAGLPVRKG